MLHTCTTSCCLLEFRVSDSGALGCVLVFHRAEAIKIRFDGLKKKNHVTFTGSSKVYVRMSCLRCCCYTWMKVGLSLDK